MTVERNDSRNCRKIGIDRPSIRLIAQADPDNGLTYEVKKGKQRFDIPLTP
jgi:hypothetical protein